MSRPSLSILVLNTARTAYLVLAVTPVTVKEVLSVELIRV